VLIPRYAAMGAAWATLISYTIAWMVVLLFFGAMRPVIWQGLRFALPVVAIALVATEVGALLSKAIVLGLGLSLMLFAGGLLLTRLLRPSDVGYASGLLKQLLQRSPS